MIQDLLFYFFAVLAVVPAILMVLSRNPVNGAMFMILSLVSVAGMFVMLNAFLLAVLQVLVYGGAVMVLFLFVIMLLDVETTSKRAPAKLQVIASAIGGGLLLFSLVYAVQESPFPMNTTGVPDAPANMPSAETPLEYATSLDAYGYALFSKYMLPFQLTGLLLLVAMIGVIVLSKKWSPEEENAGSSTATATNGKTSS